MARPSERLRLKDKIVDDVSKAIKAIQEKLYYISNDPAATSSTSKGHLILSNGDRLCHKLCDKLDHALLHGLKDVTHGYWKLVKMLSHKGMVKEIDILTNVTTDLGRGRAWLYASLNEGLLESYIHLLAENEKMVKKHYSKEALVLDSDKMSMLLTISSGLEFATFQLEYDLPYLDLSPSPPRTETGFHDEEYIKNNRKQSYGDVSYSQQSDSDSASILSCDVYSVSDRKISIDHLSERSLTPNAIIGNSGDARDSSRLSPSLKSLVLKTDRAATPTDVSHSSSDVRGRAPSDSLSLSSVSSHGGDLDRHQRFENIVNVNKDIVDETDDSLEVIHVKNKKKRKKPKPVNTASSSLVNKQESKSINMISKTEPKSSIASDKKEGEGQIPIKVSEASELVKSKPVDLRDDTPRAVIPQLDSGIGICDMVSEKVDVRENNKCGTKDASSNENSGIKDNDGVQSILTINDSAQSDFISTEEKSSLSVIERKIAEMCRDTSEDNSTSSVMMNQVNKEDETDSNIGNHIDSVVHIQDKTYNDHRVNNNSIFDSEVMKRNHSSFPNQRSKGVTVFQSQNSTKVSNSLPEEDTEDYYDVYSTKSPLLKESHKSENEYQHHMTKLQEASHLQDYMDCVLKESDIQSKDQLSPKQDYDSEDFALSLDNNTKLQVMLEIFKQEDESFVKMFACRENHTEGHFSVAFVLISDQYLYLLHFVHKSRKFAVQSVTKLTDIIFISTGLYEQTLNIESRDKTRQKQRLWLTPGHQKLTKAIVQSLTDVVKEANANIVSVRSRFSVGSDVPLQKIGLRKYISKELQCETQDVIINDYSLVFWEDPSSSKSSFSDSSTKDGTLLLRIQDPVKGFIWKPVYVLLKGSMLSVSNSKSDPRPHSYLGLGGDQCIGCRMTEVGERHHCVELVLAQGGSWFLSAATEEEILDWRRALCLAVSQGVEEMGALAACIPCCCIQASSQLFMCHEDLDTKFFRTLGRAHMEDVTGISTDKEGTTYCVVEFESQEVGVTSGKWVFHFASYADMERFTTSLAACWQDIFQVDLPISLLDDVTLQRHCQTHSLLLNKAFELR